MSKLIGVVSKELRNDIYSFLIELDKFRSDHYHEIFYYTYMLKEKKNQSGIAMILGMDQATVSRKLKEIQMYIQLKLNEQRIIRK